jgi:antitoxin component YwqK of YwqJK toxin-antitoxin module
MKRVSLSILLILYSSLFVACRNHIEVKTYYDANKKNKKEVFQVLSRNTKIKDGPYESYFLNGNLAATKRYNNNRVSDSCIIYNESPYYRSESVYYKDGLKEGIRILFHPNGKWKIIEHYSKDKLEGEYNHYDEKGRLIEEGNFKNGQMQGLWTFYFPNSTQIREKVHFVNGQEWGYYESYYANGKKKSDGYYKGEDNMDSLWHLYYESGELMEDAVYKDNWENGIVHTYDKNKQLTKEILYNKGKVVKYADFVKHVFTEHPENALETKTDAE